MRQCKFTISDSVLKHIADDCAKHGTSRERLVADAINDGLNALRKTYHAPPIQECIQKYLKENCVRGADCNVHLSSLYDGYRNWSMTNKLPLAKRDDIMQYLAGLGYKAYYAYRNDRIFYRIGLRSTPKEK
jgi:hypothetical protein